MFAFEGKYLYKIMYSDMHHFIVLQRTLLPIRVPRMRTWLYSCGIWSNPEHCLSFGNLSSGFLMGWEVPLSWFTLILWTHLGYYMMFLGRLGFLFFPVLSLVNQRLLKSSLRRNLTHNSVRVWEKKTSPPASKWKYWQPPGEEMETMSCHLS